MSGQYKEVSAKLKQKSHFKFTSLSFDLLQKAHIFFKKSYLRLNIYEKASNSKSHDHPKFNTVGTTNILFLWFLVNQFISTQLLQLFNYTTDNINV